MQKAKHGMNHAKSKAHTKVKKKVLALELQHCKGHTTTILNNKKATP
jgi:hypothetical protein